ncbi:protein kinase domain-containing protein [Aquisphaera insulae]|uniref:protein kinase domain-containing protein n=1 Tax=Aquisphaera insulae TaxID=2712864 RepID=UPI0013EE28DC|nr:tetratricopeptide repeat protein [Aquisphaera insulae]
MTSTSWRAFEGSSGPLPHSAAGGVSPRRIQRVLDDFTRRRREGEVGCLEDYLAASVTLPDALIVELAYREYCLREDEGDQPDGDEFLERFPAQRDALERLLAVHDACRLEGSAAGSRTRPLGSFDGEGSLAGPGLGPDPLPEAGDEIGPYLLRREIGRGSFARVFVAEQADLEYRQVVVKLSTRRTREPWLLARVRHPHIVEILFHAEVNDGAFQLLCMSFLGGATLSSVLDRRRAAGGPSPSRGGLLRDLDAVAAPEYSAGEQASPSRELLARLGDDHTLAWIAARLVEALDHAFGKGVSHGDVKPSNILLTADGIPMLLDFNLSQDWSSRPAGPPAEVGGTLAYMAPERLRALATRFVDDDDDAGPETEVEAGDLGGDLGDEPAAMTKPATTEAALAPHRSDLFSLGMVLLEALTGSAASSPGPAARRRGITAVATDYAILREQGAAAIIRDAEERGGRRIPRGLRHILERCLATAPSDRYRRGLEMAEDLDRWRTDRPPAYTREPFWADALPRLIRRRRRTLAVAGLALIVCLLTTGLAYRASQSFLRDRSLHRLAQHWDTLDPTVFRFRRPEGLLLAARESRDQVAAAADTLRDYDVLGGDDWRRADEFLSLPADDRFDLEIWLMEQAFRYARDLGLQPDAPGRWMQAADALDRADPSLSLPALEPLRRRLRQQLAASRLSPAIPTAPAGRAVAAGQAGPKGSDASEYIQGLTDELADGPDSPLAALGHYQNVLDRHPDSFWAHYRAAVVCFHLRRWSDAAGHLDHCLARRPGNAALHGQYASCLWRLGRLDEAMRECDRALDLAPNHAEFYRSRAFIRTERGEAGGVAADIERFEMLARSRGRSPAPRTAAAPAVEPRVDASEDPLVALTFRPITAQAAGHGADAEIPEAMVRDELDARSRLAANITRLASDEIRRRGEATPQSRGAAGASSGAGAAATSTAAPWAGMLAITEAELGKVLTLDPGHLNARISRMLELLRGHPDDAREDLARVLEHPGLDAYLAHDDERNLFLLAANRFADQGYVADAMTMVLRVYRVCRDADLPISRVRYSLARVMAVAGRTDPSRLEESAQYLFKAFQSNARYEEWYRMERAFDPVRRQIDPILAEFRKAMLVSE